jgi:hypothetical protein
MIKLIRWNIGYLTMLYQKQQFCTFELYGCMTASLVLQRVGEEMVMACLRLLS